MRKSPLAKGVGVRCMLHVGYGTQGAGKPRGCSGRRRFCWHSACPAAWLCGRARQEKPTTGTAPMCGGICNRARTGGLPSSATAAAFISTTARSIRRRTVRTRWSISHLMRATRTETWRGFWTRWRRRMLRGRSLCWAIWRGRIPTLSAGWRRRDIWCAIIRMRTGI